MDDQGQYEALKEALKASGAATFPDLGQSRQRLQEESSKNIQHTPRQQGPYIVCVSCPNQHTLTWIGPTKKFMGMDDKGGYRIEDRF